MQVFIVSALIASGILVVSETSSFLVTQENRSKLNLISDQASFYPMEMAAIQGQYFEANHLNFPTDAQGRNLVFLTVPEASPPGGGVGGGGVGVRGSTQQAIARTANGSPGPYETPTIPIPNLVGGQNEHFGMSAGGNVAPPVNVPRSNEVPGGKSLSSHYLNRRLFYEHPSSSMPTYCGTLEHPGEKNGRKLCLVSVVAPAPTVPPPPQITGCLASFPCPKKGAQIDCDAVPATLLPVGTAADLEAMRPWAVLGGPPVGYYLTRDIDVSTLGEIWSGDIYLDGRGFAFTNIRKPLGSYRGGLSKSIFKNLNLRLASDYNPNNPTCVPGVQSSACYERTSVLGDLQNSCVSNMTVDAGTVTKNYSEEGVVFGNIKQTTIRNFKFNGNIQVFPTQTRWTAWLSTSSSAMGYAECSIVEQAEMNGNYTVRLPPCDPIGFCRYSGAGGLVSSTSVTRIANARFNGDLTLEGQSFYFVGGVVGYLYCHSELVDSSATGNLFIKTEDAGMVANFVFGGLYGQQLEDSLKGAGSSFSNLSRSGNVTWSNMNSTSGTGPNPFSQYYEY